MSNGKLRNKNFKVLKIYIFIYCRSFKIFLGMFISLEQFWQEHLIIDISCITWIPEPSVNNKLKRREGSGSTGRFFD